MPKEASGMNREASEMAWGVSEMAWEASGWPGMAWRASEIDLGSNLNGLQGNWDGLKGMEGS